MSASRDELKDKNDLFFELLTRKHDRKNFDSGNSEINTYLQRYARQNKVANISQPYVLTDQSGIIYGFYTLNAAEIHIDSLPSKLSKQLPEYPVPAIKMGQMGVDKRHQGKGLGKTLLVNALQRSYRASREIAAYAVIVDAIDEKAVEFYQHFGFRLFSEEKMQLFMPMAEIGELD